MPDLYLGIHHDPHPPQPGTGTEIHVFEVEEEFVIQAAQLTVGFRTQHPKHARDPIGADDSVCVWLVRLEIVTRQTAANQLDGSRKRAVGILHGPSLIHNLGGDQIGVVGQHAFQQIIEDGLLKDEVWIEDDKIFALCLFEGAVVVFGKSQSMLVA